MPKIYKLRKIVLLCFLASIILGKFIFANTEITFYPGQPSLINSTINVFKIKNGKIVINKLPLGIIQNTIQVFNPNLISWEYSYDLSSSQALFSKIYDKKIELEREKSKKELTFLNQTPNAKFFKSGKKLIINPKGQITVPNAEKLNLTPTLLLDFPSFNINKINLSYFTTSLTSYIQYRAEYDKKHKKLLLASSLFVDNQSGTNFNKADINVIAGSPYFLPSKSPKTGRYPLRTMSMEKRNSKIESKDEYYKYVLDHKHNLNHNSLTAMPLFEQKTLKTRFSYRFETSPFYYSSSLKGASAVDLILTFTNNTGVPLAAGKIQLYSGNKFIGEDYLPATGRGEKRSIKYGKAFNIKAKKTKTNVKQLAKHKTETYKIFLTSLKRNPVKVEVIETIQSNNWKITNNSIPYNKISANKVKFTVQLMPKKTQELDYTIEYITK